MIMDKKRGLLLVFLTAIISGVSIFINKFGVNGLNPYSFAFAKNVIVALLLISLILFAKQFNEIKKLKIKQWSQLATIGLIGGSIPFLLFFKGLTITSAVSASFIQKTMFVFVIILAVIFLKERLDKKIVIAAALLLLGNALLAKLTPAGFNIGDLMILLATVLWAGENTLSKYVLKKVSPTIVAFGRMFFGSLFILVFLIATGNISSMMTFDVSAIGWIFVTSIFLFFYVWTWYTGLASVKASVATCVLSVGAVITTLLNYTFSGTAISIWQAFGIMTIIAGTTLAIIFSREISLPSQQRTRNES
jgi:drug/metabolite transporter (DMT)-like permease